MAVKVASAHVYVSGRVQGVFFRVWVKRNAEKLGVAGWAKNLNDGRVEAVFEGDARSVERMIDMCKEGPMFSKVEYVEVAKNKGVEKLSGFNIVF